MRLLDLLLVDSLAAVCYVAAAGLAVYGLAVWETGPLIVAFVALLVGNANR